MSAWLAALRGLRDNPVSHRKQVQHNRWLKPRFVLYASLLLLVGGFWLDNELRAIWIDRPALSGPLAPVQSLLLNSHLTGVGVATMLALILVLCLGLPRLYRALAALDLTSGLALDPALAAAPLRSEELVCGALAGALRPVLGAVGLTALVFAGCCGAIALEDFIGKNFWRDGIWLPPLASIAIAIAGTVICGGLASLILGLFVLTASGGNRPRINLCATACVLAVSFWLPAVTAVAGGLSLDDTLDVLNLGLLPHLISSALFVLLLTLWLAAVQLQDGSQASLAMLAPIFAPLALLAGHSLTNTLGYRPPWFHGAWLEQSIYLLTAQLAGWVPFNPLVAGINPQALLHQADWGYYIDAGVIFPQVGAALLTVGLTVLTQLATIVILAHFARNNVARWRSSEV